MVIDDMQNNDEAKTVYPPRILREWLGNISAADFYEQLKKKVWGQDEELKKAAIMVYGFITAMANNSFDKKFHFLLEGSSGSGKSTLAYALQELLPCPIVVFDASSLTDIFKMLLISILIFCILTMMSKVMHKRVSCEAGMREMAPAWKPITVFFLVAVLLGVMWLPYILSYIPGGIWGDTMHVIRMAKRETYITNYHPVAYIMIWRIFLTIGNFLGAEEYGAILYTVVQYFCSIICLGFLGYKFVQWGAKKEFIFFATLFYGLCPIFPNYALSCWVDTLFGYAVLLYTIMVYDLIRAEMCGRWYMWSALAGTSFLVMFLRNNGIYIVALTNVILWIVLFFKKRKTAKWIGSICLLVPVLFSAVVQGPVYEKLGYNENNKIESSAVLVQSVAYVICTGGDVNDEDLAFINAIIPVEKLDDTYNPFTIDDLKWDEDFNKQFFDANYSQFLRVFWRILTKNPLSVGKAWLLETIGFWDVRKEVSHGYACVDYDQMYIQQDIIDQLFGVSLRPVLNWRKSVFPSSIFIWIILLSLIKMIEEKDSRGYALIPCIAGWLTILIATPIAFHFRYVFYNSLCMPIAVFCMCSSSVSLQMRKHP